METDEYKPDEGAQNAIIQNSGDFWSSKAYEPLAYDGTHFTTRQQDGKSTGNGPQTGDVRLRWHYVPNQDVTVIAQQVQNDEGTFTFRQWNPEMINARIGEDNDSDKNATCPITCFCCWAVEKCFKSVF